MPEPRCLLSVHAHPDDEASKGAGTVARYHAAGVRSVLITCTGGEAGDILNPALDRPDVRARLAEVRREELARAAEIIGFDEMVMLGYRDSGMPDTAENADPRAFANVDPDVAAGRLVEAIRRERPHVILTYNDDQQGYPHPDHLMVHDISVLAWERAGDPDWYPDAGEPWTPLKLYYSVFSKARLRGIHLRMLELGIDSPFDDAWFDRPWQDDRITTSIRVDEWFDVRKGALLAHATQVDPDSKFWFGLPDDELRAIHPFEDYVLAAARVDTAIPEDDLFAGVTAAVDA